MCGHNVTGHSSFYFFYSLKKPAQNAITTQKKMDCRYLPTTGSSTSALRDVLTCTSVLGLGKRECLSRTQRHWFLSYPSPKICNHSPQQLSCNTSATQHQWVFVSLLPCQSFDPKKVSHSWYMISKTKRLSKRDDTIHASCNLSAWKECNHPGSCQRDARITNSDN